MLEEVAETAGDRGGWAGMGGGGEEGKVFIDVQKGWGGGRGSSLMAVCMCVCCGGGGGGGGGGAGRGGGEEAVRRGSD